VTAESSAYIQSWEDAAAAALRIIPILSGSVDARWTQRNARSLLQAILWYLRLKSDEPYVDLRDVETILLQEDGGGGTWLDDDVASSNPIIAETAQRARRASFIVDSSSRNINGTAWCALNHLRPCLRK
jgi:hypothetical protein